MKYNIKLSLEQIEVLRSVYNGLSEKEFDVADLYAFGNVLIDVQGQAMEYDECCDGF